MQGKGEEMSWTRVSALLPAVLAACANVAAVDQGADAGSSAPAVAAVDPQPGEVPADAKFTVEFSVAMDEGPLVAKTGRSESVVLAPEANAELAAAAIEHGALSAAERTLLVPARPAIAADRKSITLAPDDPLSAGKLYLLISPRLKDSDGRLLAGGVRRYAFDVKRPKATARLVFPSAGGAAPDNLRVVRAFAASGRLAVHGPDGAEVTSAEAHGDVVLTLPSPPAVGARYLLALDGAEDAEQFFTVAACSRSTAPALEGGVAHLLVRDTAVDAEIALDWPATVEIEVAEAAGGEPCAGTCSKVSAYASCAARACGPQSFDCKIGLRIDGLKPAQDYALRVVAQDDFGHELRGPVQRFSTVAPLPRVILSEVMANPPAPQAEAQYVEILNQGPGAAVLDSLALVQADGILRPLSGVPPPVPVQLAPGARALAVGSSFDRTRYPSLPPGTPVLRASTRRLLGRGLNHKSPQAFRMVLKGEVPVELAQFPGGAPRCPAGASLQRDETVPPDGDAHWTCGPVGGTPGAPP
jgi:hypothetical protein